MEYIYIYRERERERERERGKVNECCKSMNIGLTIIFRNILWEKKILGPVQSVLRVFVNRQFLKSFNNIFMKNIKKL